MNVKTQAFGMMPAFLHILFLSQFPVCRVVCAPLFHSPKHFQTARLGLRVSEQPFAQGKFSISSAGLSACSGRPLADFRRLGEQSDCFENTV